jgi:hypothetical protein
MTTRSPAGLATPSRRRTPPGPRGRGDSSPDCPPPNLGLAVRHPRRVRPDVRRAGLCHPLRPDAAERSAASFVGFLHQLPVAAGGQRRHPLGLGGHHSGHAGDRAGGRSARRRRRHLPRRIRAEEPAHRHHRDQRDQPRRRAVDHLRPAGARPVRLPVRPRPEHRRRRPDARPPDPAGGHRRHPRGDSHHPAEHPRRRPMPAAPPAGRSSRSTSSLIRCRES